MLFAVTIVIVLFVVIFKWFPLNDVKAWIRLWKGIKKVNNEEIYFACIDAGYI